MKLDTFDELFQKAEYFMIEKEIRKKIFFKDTEALSHPFYLCMKQTPLRTRLFIML